MSPHPTRRTVVIAGGLTGVLAVTGLPAHAGTAALTPAQQDVLQAVGRVGAVFPIPLPGTTAVTPTSATVTAAAGKLSSAKLAQVTQGADTLAARGVPAGGDEDVLAQVGAVAAASADGVTAMNAVAALAIGVVYPDRAAAAEHLAELWVDGLRNMSLQGTRPAIVRAGSR